LAPDRETDVRRVKGSALRFSRDVIMAEYLGQRLMDAVTGFAGVCTACTVYSTGRMQICLTSPILVRGELRSYWFDIERVQHLPAPPAPPSER